MIPTIETERLILRAATLDDWPSYWDFMQSHRAIGFGGPFSFSQAWGAFCHDIALWHFAGHGGLISTDKATGAMVGQVCLNSGPECPEHELGWMVLKAYEGQGYAFERAEAYLTWITANCSLPSLISMIHVDNRRSLSLAQRLGAEVDATATNPPDLIYRHW